MQTHFSFESNWGPRHLGSSLAIEGLTADDTWQPINDIDLDADKIVTVKVADAQVYKDADGYINLRAFWLMAKARTLFRFMNSGVTILFMPGTKP